MIKMMPVGNFEGPTATVTPGSKPAGQAVTLTRGVVQATVVLVPVHRDCSHAVMVPAGLPGLRIQLQVEVTVCVLSQLNLPVPASECRSDAGRGRLTHPLALALQVNLSLRLWPEAWLPENLDLRVGLGRSDAEPENLNLKILQVEPPKCNESTGKMSDSCA